VTDPIVVKRIDDIPRGRYVATIGTFDGVHLGHQALLASAASRARELGVPLLIVTFEPVPAQVLRPETFRGRLTTAEDKQGLLAALPDRIVAELPFTHAFAETTAHEFMEALHSRVTLLELWVGEEFALGRNRAGTIDELRHIASSHGFAVHAMERVTIDGQLVSSSRIREQVERGAIEAANALLGRPFAISGPVCEGARLGRTIGFPTANVMPVDDLVALADGIYATTAELDRDGILRPAMTYIGTRPALNPGPRVIETHLFDFDADIYDRILTTRFMTRLRPDANFPNVEELIAQMRIDEAQSRSFLGAIR
jgi:riboflavin kinase/FMN adenylyltransferase